MTLSTPSSQRREGDEVYESDGTSTADVLPCIPVQPSPQVAIGFGEISALAWNLRSLGRACLPTAKRKRSEVQALAEKFDVVVLLEARYSMAELDASFAPFGGTHRRFATVSSKAGVVVLVKRTYANDASIVANELVEGRALLVSFAWGGACPKLYVLGLHVHRPTTRWVSSVALALENLRARARAAQCPPPLGLILGDFNFVPCDRVRYCYDSTWPGYVADKPPSKRDNELENLIEPMLVVAPWCAMVSPPLPELSVRLVPLSLRVFEVLAAQSN